MRYIYRDVARDSNGIVLRSATVNVYLAGTTTAATIYTSSTSTTGVNSVTTDSTDGSFTFYIDAFDYGSYQKFKFILSKPSLSDDTFTADEISVDEVVTGTYTISTAKTASKPIFVPYGVIWAKSGTGSITFNASFDAGLYQVFSGFTTGITFGSGSTKEVYPEWWGAVGDGATDDILPIQSAVTAGIGKKVKFQNKTYLIAKAIDNTNKLSVPTTWEGSGYSINDNNGTPSGGTIILARTAADGTLSPGWIADFSGSQFVTIKDMSFFGSGTNKAVNGLLFARTTVGAYSHTIYLDHVNVAILTDATANSGNGTFAIVNNEAEMFHMKDCYVYADLPFAGTLANELSVTSPFATIANTPSLANLLFENCWFYSHLQTPVLLQGAANVKFINALFASNYASAANLYAVTLRSSAAGYKDCRNITIQGQADASLGHAVSLEGDTHNINIDMSITNQSGAYINLQAGTTHTNLKVNVDLINGGTNYSVILASGATATLKGGEIFVHTGDLLNLSNTVTNGTLFVGPDDLMTSITNASASCTFQTRDTYRTVVKGQALVGKNTVTVTWGANVTINAAAGNYFYSSITSTAAAIANPASPIDGQEIVLHLYNASGGGAGAANFSTSAGGYKLQTAWSQPANGTSKMVSFRYNGTLGNWYEQWRSAGDIPN